MHMLDTIAKRADIDLGRMQHLHEGRACRSDHRTERGCFLRGELCQVFTMPLELNDEEAAPDNRRGNGSADVPVFIFVNNPSRFDPSS